MPASEAQKRATAKYIKENLQELPWFIVESDEL